MLQSCANTVLCMQEHRQEVEHKIQLTQAAISQARRKIKALQKVQEQLHKREERADTMLEATLCITTAMPHPAQLASHPIATQTPLQPEAAVHAPARSQGLKRLLPGPECTSIALQQLSTPLYRVQGLGPPALSCFQAHIPLSYENILQHSGAKTKPIFSEHPACTLLYNCTVPTGVRHKCQQFRAAKASQLCMHYSRIAWFPQMHAEVDPGLPLSFSTTLSTPQCGASFVLACMVSFVEEALSAFLQEQQAILSTSGAEYFAYFVVSLKMSRHAQLLLQWEHTSMACMLHPQRKLPVSLS
jgi:hypothetical protein